MEYNDKKLRLFGIPVLALIMSFVVGWDSWQAGGAMIPLAIGKALVFTTVIWEGNRQIMFYLYRRFPEINQVRQRISLELVSVFTYTLTSNLLVGAFFSVILSEESGALSAPLWLHAAIALVPTIVVMSIYESICFFESWRRNVERTEAIARANMQSQFEALKKQLDPHFLFNCMNTLASLIDLENEPAQKYLDRLSEVYRYVLDTRDQSTVTIEDELRFLEAYVYLNEVRFRDNLSVSQELHTDIYQCRLPSLSLQLLVENAIKHNIASRDKPLNIRIYRNGDFVTVENNKQRKTTLQHSTKLGLQNIVKRYKLLTEMPVHIREDEHLFRVQIPILSPNVP